MPVSEKTVRVPVGGNDTDELEKLVDEILSRPENADYELVDISSDDAVTELTLRHI